MKNLFCYNKARSGAECPFRRSTAEAALSLSRGSSRMAFARKPANSNAAQESAAADEAEQRPAGTAEKAGKQRATKSAQRAAQAAEAAEQAAAPEIITPEKPVVSEIPVILQTETSKKIDIALDLATRAKAEQERKNERNDAIITRLQNHFTEFQGLAALEQKSRQKTKSILEKMVKQKKITPDEAQEILDLNVEDPEFKSKWYELTHDIEGPPTRDDLASIKAEAYELQKIEKRLFEELKNLSQTLTEAGEAINTEVFQKGAIDRYSRRLGFQLEKGAVVRFKHYRIVVQPDGSEIKEPIYRTATIKDVYFEDTEVEVEKGKPQKMPSFMPMVALQFQDEWRDSQGGETGGIEFVTAEKLKEIADTQGMVEIIEDRQETDDTDEELKKLSEILGEELKEGDEFEYREIQDAGPHVVGKAGKSRGINRKVRVVHIHKKEDPFFNQEHSQRKGHKTTYIELDHPVVVAHYPEQKISSSLTLGEFAKWYKRLNAMKPMDLKDARKKLYEDNKDRNNRYERKDREYPPIEIQEGEVLYYDTDPPQTFVIKEVDETRNLIKLDNGSEYTPATFLGWCRMNEVEKMTAQAQAHKMTAHMSDDDPGKKKAVEEAQQAAQEQIDARKEPKAPVNLPDDTTPAPPSVSYMRQLWNQTQFMSLGNLYALGKEVVEFIKRTLDRREKHAIGAVGHAAFTPIWGRMGAEFKALQQQAENERVQRFMQSYEQYGYGDLYNQLRTTSDRDELKALLQAMSAKGWINWNDPVLWGAISRVGRKLDASFYVTTYDEKKMAQILDAFWGDNSYFDFKQKNDSSFNSKKNTEKDVAAGFENDPSGRSMKMRMQELLHKHLQGEWVDAAQYEAYLEYAISAGKLTFSDKVYFMMMGIGAEGPANGDFPGRTLMDTSRVGRIAMADRILARYPIIEFFANSEHYKRDENGNIITDETGKPKVAKIDKNIFKQFIRDFVEQDGGKSIYSMDKSELTPGQRLTDYIERKIFYDPYTEERLLKASGDVSNWDHDDFHEFAPQLDESQVEQITFIRGGQQVASPAAIKNAIAGFNHFIGIDLDEYMKAMKTGDTDAANKHLYLAMRRIVAFEKLHAILDRRFQHGIHDRTRLTNELRAFAGVDKSRLVTDHMNEINSFMRGFISEMIAVDPESFRGVGESWDLITTHQSTRNDKDRQAEEMTKFSQKLHSAISALTEKIGSEGVYEIIARVQGQGPANNRVIKGILQRAESKEDFAKTEQKRYSFEYGRELEAAKDAVNKIEQLRLRRETMGRALTADEREALKQSKVNRLMQRIKTGQASLVSDEDRKLLEDEVARLEGQVGRLDENLPFAA